MLSSARPQSSISVLHIFAGERLQAFSDAVFAIIATLMVIPLKLSPEAVESGGGIEEYELEGFMLGQWSRYLIYLYSFTLVVEMWNYHVGIFSIIEQVDDVVIWLNLLCLLFISFLPYGTGLVSAYPNLKSGESIAITICALDLMLIGIIMFVILLYAFKRQSLLHPEIEQDENIVSIRRASIISVLITPCMSLLAMCFSFLTAVPGISLLFFYSISFLSFCSRVAIYLYFKRKKKVDNLPCHLFNPVGNTVRTEAFSDGVFSIVATLIVLDLTTENILSPEDLQKEYDGNLQQALREQQYVFMAYITSFVVVGLLWFVHYGMLHFLEKLTPALNFVNIITLFLVGGIPYVSGVHTIFSETLHDASRNAELYNNRAISIRAFCALLFLVGVSQLIFWTVAWFQKEKCMSKNVDKYGSEALQISKIMVFPVMSFIIFWGTFSENFVSYNMFSNLLYSTPVIFLILKGLFRRNDMVWKKMKMLWRKKRQRRLHNSNGVNSIMSERVCLKEDEDTKATTTPMKHIDDEGNV